MIREVKNDMIKWELKARTGFLIRDVIWLLDREGSIGVYDRSFVLERAIELQADMKKRWYHRLMWWKGGSDDSQ